MIHFQEYTVYVASSPDINTETRWASPALQNLQEWLTSKGADQLTAKKAPEIILALQTDILRPALGKPLPIGIQGWDNPVGLYIRAFIPALGMDKSTVQELTRQFEETTELPNYQVIFLLSNEAEFDEKVARATIGHNMDFLGTYRMEV